MRIVSGSRVRQPQHSGITLVRAWGATGQSSDVLVELLKRKGVWTEGVTFMAAMLGSFGN